MTLDLMRAFVLRHRLALAILSLLLTLGYFVLAVTDPRTATPIGIGYIAVVLLLMAVVRLYEHERRRR
jgi:hypothetical protein